MVDRFNRSGTAHEFAQTDLDLVADTPEHGNLGFGIAFGSGRVVKTPVNSFGPAGKYRTTLFGVVANGYDVIKRNVQKLIKAFRTLIRYVYSDLGHCGDRLRPHKTRNRPCAFDLKPVARDMPQQSLGHLAACRVPGAEYQYFLFFHC